MKYCSGYRSALWIEQYLMLGIGATNCQKRAVRLHGIARLIGHLKFEGEAELSIFQARSIDGLTDV